jgi:Ser/Thr protein kinase RdoA (MazF antagonist)
MTSLASETEVTPEALAALLARYGLPPSTPVTRMVSTGIINTIYAVGNDLVLRVPRVKYGDYIRKEARVVPQARTAGVRTPALIAMDDWLDILRVPYALYERVHAATLGLLHVEPAEAAHAWHELGRDLGRLHAGIAPIPWSERLGARAETERPPRTPQQLVEEEAAPDGWLTPIEARWLLSWFDRLAPLVERGKDTRVARLLHADTQPTNVMVDGDTLEYRALIDWGDARWGDPADEFVGPPLRAVPYMLAGYREVLPLDDDETAEARILWGQLRFMVSVLWRGKALEYGWGERPLPRLIEIARFFLEDHGPRWAALAPPAGRVPTRAPRAADAGHDDADAAVAEEAETAVQSNS